MIPGVVIALEGMMAGGHRSVRIPSELAWGMGGAGALIPPGADLECELWLIEIIEVEDG